MLLFEDKEFIIESKFLIPLYIAGEKKKTKIQDWTFLYALKTGWP